MVLSAFTAFTSVYKGSYVTFSNISTALQHIITIFVVTIKTYNEKE